MTDTARFPLPPGSRIGILGGGQLGRMLSEAASRLGLDCVIYSPGEREPAARVAAGHVNAAYDDLDAVKAFAADCDVVTYEFENVPADCAAAAVESAPLYPPAKALEVAQDRLNEKTFIRDVAGVPVTGFQQVDSADDLKAALDQLGAPVILKTRRFGYDGKGQVKVASADEAESALEQLDLAPCIAEMFCPFEREVSVVLARAIDGTMRSYPVCDNHHENHILARTIAPADIDAAIAEKARENAAKIAEALGYVGILSVEYFVLESGELLVNEIAPRVHNSGHWTQDAGCTDQFEQHIRAICGWPLGSAEPLYQVEMRNLIGDQMNDWRSLAAQSDTFLHLYGKREVREGRKMGHVNRVLKKL